MATSTIPAAIDYLVTTTQNMSAFAAPVVVFDGWPDQGADTALVIGITPTDDTTGVENLHAELGAQAQWEEFDIPCIIWAHRGGGQESMKTARDAAFALYDALDTHLRTNAGRTLGGLLNSGVAYISALVVQQTGDAPEAGDGRQCQLLLNIHCKSRSAA